MADEAPTSKACTKCGVVKPLGEFHKRKLSKDGFNGICKECSKARKIKWNTENPEKVKAYWVSGNAKQYAKNPEKSKERVSKYYLKNHEKKINSDYRWRINNPEKVKAARNRYGDELSDGYVAQRLKSTNSQVTQELLEAKRMELILKRAIKAANQALTKKSSKS